jgi:hypothetical protein
MFTEMKNMIIFIVLSLFTLIAFLLVHTYEQYEVFADSPSFPIQQIFDDVEDWNISVNSSEIAKSTDVAEDSSDCAKSFEYIPSDITTVNYYSDGKYLYATLWLSSPLEEFVNNLTSREYVIYVDVKSVYDAGISDYGSGISWRNSSDSWTKELYEYSAIGDRWKYLKIMPNNTGFFERGNNYVSLSLDLELINLPEEYTVIFATADTFRKNNNVYCNFLDNTGFFSVPPPQYNITTSQNSLFLKKGQEKTIELRMKSDANFNSYSYLSKNQIKGLEVGLSPTQLSLPSNGITTSLIHIKALENATVGPYTLSIKSSVYPNETLSSGFAKLKENLPHSIPGGITDLTVIVEEPLGVLDYVNNALNMWGAPIREFFAIVTTISGAGISGWIINKIRLRRKRKRIIQHR